MRHIHRMVFGVVCAGTVAHFGRAQTTPGTAPQVPSQPAAGPSTNADTTQVDAERFLQQAFRDARASNKPVLVYFSDAQSPRSGMGTAFESVVRSPVLGKPLRDNFVLVHLTRGKPSPRANLLLQEIHKLQDEINSGKLSTEETEKALRRGQDILKELNAPASPADSIWRALDQPDVVPLDSGGKRLPGFTETKYPFSLERLWPFTMQLKQAAPHMTEADRKRLLEYLMPWT